jgi:arsenate reductase (glutaredoxin)
MTEISIYHNPRCSKSRETLALLENRGLSVKVVEYLKQTPTFDDISKLLVMLDLSARQLMRTKETEYKALGLDDNNLTESELINAMVNTPKLIERPIVLANGKAAIGRPPENVLAIL